MPNRLILSFLLPLALWGAPEWVLIRTVDGTQVEGQCAVASLKLPHGAHILSVHNASPASDFETGRITAGLAALQAADRKASDQAVAELTAIGLPVLTPLLKTLKDTDQHEPRPLYRLFERLIPSSADGLDRSLSLVRLPSGEGVRCRLPEGTVEVRTPDGGKASLPWSKIRTLAVRQKMVKRSTPVHSLRHCTQIEYLDTGVVLTAASKLDVTTQGFVRLSWDVDGWATDADGLKKPGSPAYKTNLVDGHPFGALVGRIGPDGEVFFLGKKASKSGLPAGRLGLAVNDNRHWQNNLGSYTVTLSASEAYDLGDAQ
ncbi:MAG TPA: hypothetical protein VL285_26305 [Bryobacteraceae bacterium]|jgi:hypothetical protein|nr:hypothetical protein [Bryobacteraceae bacterium]